VASPGGSVQVRVNTLATVAAAGAAGPAGASCAQQVVDVVLAIALLPAPHRRPADAGAARHLHDRQPVGGKQNDPARWMCLCGRLRSPAIAAAPSE
jgi:hypothetical protein